jgi:uncharacterized protein (DUF488 family)
MEILTIGHGDHPIERFIELLRMHRIELLIDTRSQPFSQRHPQFSQRTLAGVLDESGITYAFMGDTLGGRPKDPSLYGEGGKPDYAKMAEKPSFKRGIEELTQLASGDETVAILCSEGDYHECHRYKLVSRALALDGVEVRHILRDGSLEDNPAPQMSLPLTEGFE